MACTFLYVAVPHNVCVTHRRKREAELLAALEAVIQRCKELELAQYQQQVLSEPHQSGNGNGALLPSSVQPNARRAQTAYGGASAITPSGMRGRSANADYSDRPLQAAQASKQPPPPPQQSSSADRSRSKSAERRQSRAWH
jgi:hypothetical protein